MKNTCVVPLAARLRAKNSAPVMGSAMFVPSVLRGRLCPGGEPWKRFGQQAGETRGPCCLAVGSGDQVLADFDFNVFQSAALGVKRQAVIAVGGQRVRRFLPHGDVAVALTADSDY